MREFFIESPVESPRHVETLAMVAHYHSFEQHRLAHGAILDLGRPWLEGSTNQHVLVAWPYVLDPRQASCTTALGAVEYLWLVPVSEAEAQLARADGAEKLEERLESSGVNLLDPRRESVA